MKIKLNFCEINFYEDDKLITTYEFNVGKKFLTCKSHKRIPIVTLLRKRGYICSGGYYYSISKSEQSKLRDYYKICKQKFTKNLLTKPNK